MGDADRIRSSTARSQQLPGLQFQRTESQIEPRRDARSSPDLPRPDDSTIGDGHCAKATKRRLCPPMGCCELSLEETRGGQNKRAGASYRRSHRARLMRALQPFYQSSVAHRRRCVGLRAWREDEKRVRHFFERMRSADDQSVRSVTTGPGSCATNLNSQSAAASEFHKARARLARSRQDKEE